MKIRACLITSLLIAGAAHGQVYQWTDEHGRVQFSDTRPPVQPTSEVQEVKISEGNFIHQDEAQRERNREYFDSRLAERERERQTRRAAAAEAERSQRIGEAARNRDQMQREQDQIQAERNALRNHSPHLLAPRARRAPGVP